MMHTGPDLVYRRRTIMTDHHMAPCPEEVINLFMSDTIQLCQDWVDDWGRQRNRHVGTAYVRHHHDTRPDFDLSGRPMRSPVDEYIIHWNSVPHTGMQLDRSLIDGPCFVIWEAVIEP